MLAATAASAEVGAEAPPVAPGERVKARGAGRNWEDGRTGPLHTGDIFDVSLVRDETQMFVCRDYNVRGNEADDAFNSFICLRNLFYEQHPDLGACRGGAAPCRAGAGVNHAGAFARPADPTRPGRRRGGLHARHDGRVC